MSPNRSDNWVCRGRRSLWVGLIAVAVPFVSCDDGDIASPPYVPPTFEVMDWAYHMTPDARRVIYRHRTSRDLIGGVYILEIGDSISQTLLFADSLPFFANDCRFSPDGRRVVYTRDFRSDIYVRNLDDSTDTQVTFTGGNALSADWDPTGRYIVYMRVFLPSGMPDSFAGLHVVDIETLEDVSLRAGGQVLFGSNPRWSPDGFLISYSLQTPVGAGATPPHIYVARADRSAAIDLTPGDKRRNEYPEWLSAGPEVVFESYGGPRDHMTQVMGTDGGGRRTLPVDVRPYIAYGAIAADAARCVYTGPDPAGEYGVLFVRGLSDAQGATIRQLTTYLPPDSGVVISDAFRNLDNFAHPIAGVGGMK